MRRVGRIAPFVLLLCLASQAPAQKTQSYYLKADQTADLHDPKLVIAKQNCVNWGLAAGLETMLAAQKVVLDQSFWVLHINYGELCVEKLPTIELLTKVVNQEFTLEDGRHVRLELHFLPGAPKNIDNVLAQLSRDEPSLLLWRGHPYYLTGMTYDEHIGSNGSRLFEAKEFRLTDTLAEQPATSFKRGRDNPDEIEGILSVRVTPLSLPL
jgi:hypothetical protein